MEMLRLLTQRQNAQQAPPMPVMEGAPAQAPQDGGGQSDILKSLLAMGAGGGGGTGMGRPDGTGGVNHQGRALETMKSALMSGGGK